MTRRRAPAPALRRTVLCKKFGSPALASENIDILQRELDPLFRREDANPTGIWGECMIVKLHCISHFEPSKAPRDGFIALGSEFSLLAASSLSVSRLAHTLSSSFRTKSTSRPPSLTRKSRYSAAADGLTAICAASTPIRSSN